MRRALLAFTFFWLLFLGASEAELVPKKGRIRGQSFANLRSGPNLSHPVIAILKEGEEVTVEGIERSWYLVFSPGGKRGFVHNSLIHVFEKVEATETARDNRTSTQSEERRELEVSAPQGKPLPVVKVLEGKEWEILWWFVMALCIFVIGWICGGNYYLRRDRNRRTKLRF